jgi:amino acid transporter
VLANSARPLATAAAEFLPFNATAVVAFGGLLATASSVHAVMAAGVKMPYSWAWDEVFPRWFAAVSDRFGTPHFSLFTLWAVATALTFWSQGLNQALAIATFSYLIAYLTVSLTLLYVYFAEPGLRSQAAFDYGAALVASGVVAVLGAGLLITQAADWVALFSGRFGELSTLRIYIPWMVVGGCIFAAYWYRGKRAGTDVQKILDTLPGVPSDEYDPDVRETGVSDD